MKFTAIALLGSVAAQMPCEDKNVQAKCTAGACCGWLIPAAGDAVRACSNGNQSGAAAYKGEDVFTCENPDEGEEGASKIVIGASVLVAGLNLYMM